VLNKILNIQSFNIIAMRESADRFLVEATSPLPLYCPDCGTVTNLYKHGKKQQLFFDLSMYGKHVGIFGKG